MRLPIIVCEQGDILCFESIELAERYLEPIDICNDEYRCFDADAQELTLTVMRRIGIFNKDIVKISETQGGESKKKFLREVVSDFLVRCGILGLDETHRLNLHELVDCLPRTE